MPQPRSAAAVPTSAGRASAPPAVVAARAVAPAAAAPVPVAALDLPLCLTFPCRPGPQQRATRHEVVVGADWTVTTGHDEELERIAAALGSGVSCIPVLAGLIPAFRVWWHRATRRNGPVIRSPDLGRRWDCTDGAFGCCPASGFPDPVAAATHAREARHVAAATGADRRQLVALVAGLGRAADPAPPPCPGVDPDTRRLVDLAWGAGLPPTQVLGATRPFTAAGRDLDVSTLLGLAQTGADPNWLLATATSVPGWTEPRPAGTPTDVEPRRITGLLRWLAWTATDLDAREPAARSAWLATGARRSDILALSDAGYQAEAAGQVAEAWGISRAGAAQLLARWVASGYRPHPAHLAGLREVGLTFPPGPPAPAAVDRLGSLLAAPARDPGERTGLAVAMVRHGTLQGAAAALVRARAGPPTPRHRPV